MPAPLAPPPLTSPVMQVPMHFPGPNSPQAPTAAIDLAEDREDKLWLRRLVESLRAENAKIQDELTAERRHMNVMTAELAEARAENRRLTAEARAANWRSNSWYNSGRNDGW